MPDPQEFSFGFSYIAGTYVMIIDNFPLLQSAIIITYIWVAACNLHIAVKLKKLKDCHLCF